ncbi:Stk1 family PASTA domain-containing Ser/Thr kinase [Desulforamulus ruminis]|uniref:non-specific serine/threonine protein kinase n=1 Tax=Desulforamulus ruminis (strain ATCC 23193 / DSM 2154 / NCIMB 8452 / DL) TaxID=696281 RepID=F6DM82_DESRL|nr:Stk1 family PASTA domain-containing Ser/Thr kinase [Desulforamulus ruminis]AEG60549.1 Serine/threonine-protein kinase-like domain protein [Desulforamulus ruminis DSM 2154]
MIGKLLGNRYEILEQLGGGGMALVWKGKDTFLNRLVTIKVLRPEYASDEDFVRRFRREAQAVASLSHPNIVSIYDVGQENGAHYLVMEYVDGESLKDLIRREAPLSPARAAQLGRQIAEALEHAHENSIIHRDVKPHNILITRSGRAKLTDFGIAQASAATVTHTDAIVGSVHYISPEQAKGEPAGPKSDIYSLGVALFEMLTGQVPYQGDGAIGVAMKHIQEQPPSLREINPEIPEDLEKVVLRAMDKIPERRHKSARALGDDLISISEETRSLKPFFQAEDEMTRILPLPTAIKEEKPARPAEAAAGSRRKMTPAAKGLLALLVLVLILGLAFAFNSYLNVGEVKVPPVAGMDVDDAQETLKQAGLTNIVVTKQAHNTVEKDMVISQDPGANQIVKKSRQVSLLVSTGPELTVVPDVLGFPLDQAKITLENEQFEVVELEAVYSETVEAGNVAVQEPKGKSKAGRGSTVELRLSKGPKPEVKKVPDLTGLTQEAARAKLAEQGLELHEEIGQVPSNDYLTGHVVSQDPVPEAEVEQGSKVKVTLSAGPGPAARDVDIEVKVPDDGRSHQVKIQIEDAQGVNDVYVKTHSPGDYVSEKFRYYGKGYVRVYIDGTLVKNQAIQ